MIGSVTEVGVRAASLEGEVVQVELADGTRTELHILALRDGCPRAECRHPVSGQRLFESSRMPARPKVCPDRPNTRWVAARSAGVSRLR